MTLLALANDPAPDPDLAAVFAGWLVTTGRTNTKTYAWGTRDFFGRWPDGQSWANEPLEVRLAAGVHIRPVLNFLMLHGHVQPGYDYLLDRKLASIRREAVHSPLGCELDRFMVAAAELGYTERTSAALVSQVTVRLLIQTGKTIDELVEVDIVAFDAAIAAREQRHGRTFTHYSNAVIGARAVLYHLGANIEAPAWRRSTGGKWDWDRHLTGVNPAMAASMVAYLKCCSGTRVRSTVQSMACRLASFGRFLADHDPALDSLAGIDRQQHIEPWLTAVGEARHPRTGAVLSASERRSRILTVGRMFDDINEWQWVEAPGRKLVFSRDVPRQPRALPRYLGADTDRRLVTALETSPNRVRSDALLLLRATGMRVGELVDLEIDCVHEVPGQGAWLKVPLGKLDTERMVPLDEETVEIVDRIVANRSPGLAVPHPRTGRLVEFLLTHQGRRISACTLRDELAEVAVNAGLPHVTPHQLRHTYATALVNAGVSLQALMALLGHRTAEMSLRYGRLFDETVRVEYERALTLAKQRFGPVLPQPSPVQLNTNWRDAPAIKASLAGGFCIRAEAQGPCPYANICEHCPNFRTDIGYLPVLASQRIDAEALAADAETRGWIDEVARHRRLIDRLDHLMTQAQ